MDNGESLIAEGEPVALPGALPSSDDIPILQKQIDGPISRLLKTVVDETPSSSPATATTTAVPLPGPKTLPPPVEDDPLDGEPIKLTIREIKFKDPLEIRTPSDTAAPLSDFGRAAAAEFQDGSRNRELNLDGDTNVQAATSGDAVVVVDSATTEIANETAVEEGDPRSKSSTEETLTIKTSQCTASTVVGEQEWAAAVARDGEEKEEEGENGDDGGRIPDTSAELKESSATAPDVAEDKERPEPAQSPPEGDHRRSNDSLQVKVVLVEGAEAAAAVAEEVFQEEDTIDGLLLLHEVNHDCSDGGHHREEGDGKLQQTFQVELLEEQQQQQPPPSETRSDCANSELSSPAIVKEALKSTVPRAPNTKASSPPPPEVDPEAKVQSVVHATSEPREVVVGGGEVEDCVQVAVNSADISDALVVVPSKQPAPAEPESNGRTVVEHAEDSLKIRRSVDRNSAIVDDLVTRIASYYSTRQSAPEDDEEEEARRKRRPPVPIKTYQWEDIRRAKQQGGYPWTHLYKAPLGPEDEPELLQRIRTLPKQRRRFEQKLIDSGSPKSQKRVRIDTEVLVQETEKYIQSLDDNNNNVTEESEYFLQDAEQDNEPAEPVEEETVPSAFEFSPEEAPRSPLTRKKSFRKGLQKLNPSRLLRRTPKPNLNENSAESKKQPEKGEDTSQVKSRPRILCHPIVVKLRELAKRQIKRTPSKAAPKKTHLSPEMEERQHILQLRESPKAGGREISAYIERQESDDAVEIVQLKESPGEVKRRKGQEAPISNLTKTFVEPDEILSLPIPPKEKANPEELPDEGIEPTISEILEEELRNDEIAPKKVARRQKEHYYEDIDPIEDDPNEHLNFTLMTPEMMNPAPPNIDLTLIGGFGELIKTSLAQQDDQMRTEMIMREKRLSDMFTQSSGEEEDQSGHQLEAPQNPSKGFLLAPISSIDSASSEEDRKIPLTPVAEESDRESIVTSPAILSSEDSLEEEPRKEDIRVSFAVPTSKHADADAADCVHDDSRQREEEAHALVSSVLSTAVHVVNDRWRHMSDHEYEPIGAPIEDFRKSPSPLTEQTRLSLSPPKNHDEEEVSIQDIQDEIENRYFALTPTTTGSRTDCEVNTSCVDSSAIEDLPLDRGSRRRWNVGERSKQMQQRFKTGAGKLKTKFRSRSSDPKPVEDNPIAKDKKKFKAPEFSKLKNMQLFQKKPAGDVTPRPTILVSDTTIEIDHKPAPKTSFASKFKSPDFSKITPDFSKFKEKFTKSEAPTTPNEEDLEVVDKPRGTSIFKKFEFKKSTDTAKASEPVETQEVLEDEEVQKMDTIKVSQEAESRGSGSPLTPEPPVTPDCYEVDESEDKERQPKTSRFRPDLSKIKDFKRPQFTKFEFKRPEFHRPKFSKPDMSRFKMPQRFHTLTLKRTKSLKEPSGTTSTTDSEAAMESKPKRTFDFGTYPRILSKIRKGSGGAIPKSGRPSTPPPPVIFTTMATSDGTSENESRVDRDLDNESGSYQKYGNEAEYSDRETSVERRMREHFRKAMDEDSVDETGITRETAEQRQINSFNEENRAIHEISHARRDEFQQRKPFVHQDSDLMSEDSAGKWAHQMDDEKLAEQAMINRLLQHDIELQKQNDLDRRSLPQSNKDTISSGSASDRQRTNVIEEIDDDEFFLRSKGISQDNIRIGEYISSAIREGLQGQTVNSLKQVGGNEDDYRYYDDEDDDMPRNYDYDVPPRRPRRVKNSEERNRMVRNKDIDDEEEEYELRQDFDRALKAGEDDGYFTVGPNRPTKRGDSQNNNRYESSELNRSFYDNESEIIMMDDEEMVVRQGLARMPPPTPPKVPKRKKKMASQMIKRIEKMDGFTGRSVSNSALVNSHDHIGDTDNVVVYRTEFEIPPIATPEKFTPIPTPRRTRSRSQISRLTDDDRTSHGAESLVHDALENRGHKNVLDLHKNGYAIIKKDPPPRPPAPLRRKRSTKSLGSDRQFNTMPLPDRKASSPPPPPRPNRNYSTIVPSRPPRTKSISSLGDAARPSKSSPNVTEYEEIGASRDLQSGAIVNKMKDRPLPPPPRPDRTLPRRKKEKTRDPRAEYGDEDDKKPSDDRDGGAERIVDCEIGDDAELERAQYTPPLPIDQQMSFEEMDISTQTEPLPEDYVCDELDISADMKTITPTQSKTLEDILKEEQEAEFERAQQQVAEVSLSRGLQRFRDANQRSISEKSWASRDRPKTPLSTHISPHASALRMNIESFVEGERQGVSQQVSVVNNVDHEREEENEMKRNIVDHLESEKEDTNDKILNLEVEQERDEEEIRATAVQVLQSVESEIERQAQRLENIIDRLSSEGSPPGSPPIVRARPPMAPPRRKSSIEDPRLTGIANDLSSRLQLDVDRLNVNQLNAGNITAQDIHTGTITANGEVRAQGSYTSAASIPDDVINQIAERILNSEQMQSRVTAANQQSSASPAPPSGFFAIPTEYLNSLPPPSFYQLRDPDEGVTEEKQKKVAQDPREGTSSGEQPSVLRLGGEFLNACGGAFMRNVRELMNMIPSSLTKEGAEGETSSSAGRRDINVILLILIIIIVCLLAFAMGGARTVHHHHWDFFNPPGSESLD